MEFFIEKSPCCRVLSLVSSHACCALFIVCQLACT